MRKHIIGLIAVSFAFGCILEPTVVDAQEKKKKKVPPTPPVVSPARPDIKPPDTQNWFCPVCDAHYPFLKKHYTEGNHFPSIVQPEGIEGGDPTHSMPRRARARSAVASDRILYGTGDLDLSEDQITRLQKISFETKKRLIDLNAESRRARLELQQLIHSGEDDMKRIRRHLGLMAKSRVGVQEARIANWFDARRVLSGEQLGLLRKRHPNLPRIIH